jgi:hypothetical protein
MTVRSCPLSPLFPPPAPFPQLGPSWVGERRRGRADSIRVVGKKRGALLDQLETSTETRHIPMMPSSRRRRGKRPFVTPDLEYNGQGRTHMPAHVIGKEEGEAAL